LKGPLNRKLKHSLASTLCSAPIMVLSGRFRRSEQQQLADYKQYSGGREAAPKVPILPVAVPEKF